MFGDCHVAGLQKADHIRRSCVKEGELHVESRTQPNSIHCQAIQAIYSYQCCGLPSMVVGATIEGSKFKSLAIEDPQLGITRLTKPTVRSEFARRETY